jgi:hypothetical protein
VIRLKNISIDIETFSDVDLNKCGVYKYAESPNFEILLFGYAIDGGEVQVIDLAQGEHIPQEVLDALTDDTVPKWAFNANFERVCLSRYLSDLGVSLDPFYDNRPLSQECAQFLNLALVNKNWTLKLYFLHTICYYCTTAYVSLYCLGVRYPSEYAGRSSLKNFIYASISS